MLFGMLVAIAMFVGGLAYFLFKVIVPVLGCLTSAYSYVSTVASVQVHSRTTSSYDFWYFDCRRITDHSRDNSRPPGVHHRQRNHVRPKL
jgi:hypothetical protein